MSMNRKGKCYKCKADVEFNIPVLSKEFRAHIAKCECGHEMTIFRPRDPVRAKALDRAFKILSETLSKDKK